MPEINAAVSEARRDQSYWRKVASHLGRSAHRQSAAPCSTGEVGIVHALQKLFLIATSEMEASAYRMRISPALAIPFFQH